MADMPMAATVATAEPVNELESIFAAYENGDEEVRVEILTNFFTVGSNTVTPTPALESFTSAEFARLVRLPFPNGSAWDFAKRVAAQYCLDHRKKITNSELLVFYDYLEPETQMQCIEFLAGEQQALTGREMCHLAARVTDNAQLLSQVLSNIADRLDSAEGVSAGVLFGAVVSKYITIDGTTDADTRSSYRFIQSRSKPRLFTMDMTFLAQDPNPRAASLYLRGRIDKLTKDESGRDFVAASVHILDRDTSGWSRTSNSVPRNAPWTQLGDRAIGPAIAVMSDAQPNFQLPWPLPLLGTHGHCTVSIVLREADEVMELMSSGPPEGVCIPDDAMVDVGGGADAAREENDDVLIAFGRVDKFAVPEDVDETTTFGQLNQMLRVRFPERAGSRPFDLIDVSYNVHRDKTELVLPALDRRGRRILSVVDAPRMTATVNNRVHFGPSSPRPVDSRSISQNSGLSSPRPARPRQGPQSTFHFPSTATHGFGRFRR